MLRCYGIGKEGDNKKSFNIFLGNKMIEIEWDRIMPTFYYYRNMAWSEQTAFNVKLMVGVYIAYGIVTEFSFAVTKC